MWRTIHSSKVNSGNSARIFRALFKIRLSSEKFAKNFWIWLNLGKNNTVLLHITRFGLVYNDECRRCYQWSSDSSVGIPRSNPFGKKNVQKRPFLELSNPSNETEKLMMNKIEETNQPSSKTMLPGIIETLKKGFIQLVTYPVDEAVQAMN